MLRIRNALRDAFGEEHFKCVGWLDESLTRRLADVLSALREARVINEAKQRVDYQPLHIT